MLLLRWRLHVASCTFLAFVCLFHCGLSKRFKDGRQVIGNNRGKLTNVPRTTIPSIAKDLKAFNCDFDSSFCGWLNDSSAEFNWFRTANKTPTKETGPPWDHTHAGVRGKGSYLFIETSLPREYGDKARIVSPVINNPGTYCLSFWHHMHGADVKDLNVYMRNLRSRKNFAITRLSGPWSVESNVQTFDFGQDGDWWNEQNVELKTYAPTRIIFEGVRGKNYRGDIALDDISLAPGKCPIRSIDCGFENNTCGWTQMSNDDFNWIPNRGGTLTRDTGPSHDHTLGNQDGRYLYIEASYPRQEGDKARLISPPISCDIGAKPVFNFWYNMRGDHIGPLRIFATKDEKRLGTPLWEMSGQQGPNWFLGQVTIPDALLSGHFKIAIEAESKDYQGDTAIDDVSLVGCRKMEQNFGSLDSFTTPTTTTTRRTTNAPPSTPSLVTARDHSPAGLPDGIECNFDKNNMCGWRQDSYRDHFDWELNQKGTHSVATGPSSDHTTRKGWYLYLEASEPVKKSDTAMIRSPAIPLSIHSCLSFYYHMMGKDMGKLEVLTSRQGGTRFERKWVVSGQQSVNDTDWKLAKVTIHEAYNYEIIFRGIIGTGFYSDIAIDDISIDPMPCEIMPTRAPESTTAHTTTAPTEKPNRHVLDCNFDSGNPCYWTQVNEQRDEFDWSFPNEKTKRHFNLTGPSTDHTKGSRDGYTFIEASTPRKEGDRAILESPEFDIDTHMCFRMWYHMYGNDTGDLTVYRKISGENDTIIEWSRSGNRGNIWLEALIDIRGKGRMSLLVEAKRGEAWKGDIGIDDFSITEGECEKSGCDFENGNCRWTQEQQNDEFDWTTNSANTSSKNTGPQFDSTIRNETGHYLFIEASNPRVRNDRARLYSPVLDPKLNTSMCLSFWYHSYGKHIGAINVYKVPAADNSHFGDPLWYVDRNEGDQWLYAEKTITHDEDDLPFQIVFEGVRGADYMGDVAIDDIDLKEGKCVPCCGESRFQCGNNFCLHASQRCNGIKDCWDGSDEAFCDHDRSCGSPLVPPIIREPEIIPHEIVRDHVAMNLMPPPPEEEDRPPEEHDFPDLVNEKVKGFAVPKLTREQAKLIAHPQLGFNLVVDAGYYSENVYQSHSGSAAWPEAIKVERRRRESPLRSRSFRAIRKRSVNKEMEDVKTFKKHSQGSDGRISHSGKVQNDAPGSAQKNMKSGSQRAVDNSESDLQMTDLLLIQRREKNMKNDRFNPTNWQEHADIVSYSEKRRKIQSTMGASHLLPNDQWKLMAPFRKYMTRKEVRRARRSVKKVVGGVVAKNLNYPWQAAYYITDSGTKSHYFCGATLIDPYWVITAAHCPHLGDEHVIVLGDYDLFSDEGTEQECIVDALYINQRYTFSEDLVADIALIQLRYPARQTQSIIPACLLKPEDEPFPAGEICVSTGWGRVKSDSPGLERYLKHIEMPIISNHDCKTTFWSIFSFHDSYICAGGTGGNTCRGDSGGPLVCRKNDQFYLAGITSWGDTRCQPHIPGIYTRVQSYAGWMNKIMKYRTACKTE